MLVFEDLITVAVQRALCYIGEDFDRLVIVALTDTPAVALLQVARAVRRVQMMQRGKPSLHVRARAALFRTADKDTDLALVHFVEQCLLILVSLGVVDKSDLVLWHAALDEFML